ncbi:MAG: chloride channel protein [Candidatus Amulumruptor caecigallinarius]|nr:chloride channel protein [Candidatus Amulumruptor caecigallinarius]
MKYKEAILQRWEKRAELFRFRCLRWIESHLSKNLSIVIIAVLVGIFTGCAAGVLKRLVHFFNSLALTGVKLGHPNYRFLVLPLAGVLLTSVYQRYVAGLKFGRCTYLIKRDLNSNNFLLDPLMIFNPIIGCSLTMGFGATGGTEGPTALSGASIGSTLGQWFRLPDQWVKIFFAIGAGAGIAAIFKAPIGGVLFTLEVLQMQMSTISVLSLVLASLISSSTAYVMSDYTFDIYFDRHMAIDMTLLGWVALFGLFCGLYSIYYSYMEHKAGVWFRSIRNPWSAALLTGGLLSLAVFFFPALFGEGFGIITPLVNNADTEFIKGSLFEAHKSAMWVLGGVAVMMLIKSPLVAASYSGGGVAGEFVPAFFTGALAGFMFATIANMIFGVHLPIWYFALIGMGCVMAGAIHAPLMAIFILCETTNTFGYIFPYLIAISITYATVKIITPHSKGVGPHHDDLGALWGQGPKRL